MTVERYERLFLALGGTLLVICIIALFVGSLSSGIHLPGAEGRIDPAQVTSTPPFDNPGVRQLGANSYEVVVTGKAWQFNPKEIRLPVGADVTFTATSVDVIHGFSIEGTRLNMMLIPGQISRNTYHFSRPGEYLLICHEYCGGGHHTMYGKVIVE